MTDQAPIAPTLRDVLLCLLAGALVFAVIFGLLWLLYVVAFQYPSEVIHGDVDCG